MTNSYEDKLNDLTNIFGEMKNLSDEEQMEYNNILDDLFEDTGINLFDLFE
jgi:hypothetical protein